MKKIFKKWYFWVGAFFLFIILLGSSGSSTNPQTDVASVQTETKPVASESNGQILQETAVPQTKAAVSNASTDTAAKTPAANPVQQLAQQPAGYKVTEVVDGDTVRVNINGTVETLRIIGLNTPETVDPRKPVECFGKEASAKAKELLLGKIITLEKDSSQGEKDKYGRTLRYVFLSNGTDYGKLMIQTGYAYEYTYNTPYKYQAAYKAAQKTAETNKVGLWAPNACNGFQTTTASPAAPQTSSSTNYYTSSHYSAKYYYPASCDGWETLSKQYLKSFETLEALKAAYPSRTLSPQC